MGLYREHILPRGIDWALSRPDCLEQRRLLAPGLHGTVLEVGFGSGRNLPYLPPEVTRLIAVDPAKLGRRLAADRIAASHADVEFVELDQGRLPLPDGSVDCVLSTWTLCSISDLPSALAELRRVLVPQGRFHFLEHGISPDARVARWQGRLEPLQKLFAGGCQLTVPIFESLADAGFTVGEPTNFYMKGPKVSTYMYRGIARPSSPPTPAG